MPATVSVKQRVGSSGSPSDTSITNLRHNTDDTVNPGAVNPLIKPATGTKYGFWKTIFLNADTTPAGTINNIRFFSDGAIGWTGVVLKAGTTATYTEATGTVGDTGDASSVADTDVADYDSTTPLSVAGSIDNPNTGKISDFVVLQANVGTGAVAGTLPAETLTWKYDET